MNAMNAKKEDADYNVMQSINKITVFQDARIFNSNVISPKNCRVVLCKISFLLSKGEKIPVNEATELFFGITKLFQHKDVALRQMVHVILKQLSHLSDDTLVVTSSIMKDASISSDVIFKPNALRAMCRVIDFSSVPTIERYIKASIVDKISSISSAALVSTYHLLPIALESIKRWASEVQEAAISQSIANQVGNSKFFVQIGYKTSPSGIAQYHAISLLYILRQNDKMSIFKLIQQLTKKSTIKHANSNIMLIRFIGQMVADDINLRGQMLALLQNFLNFRAESVAIEAAKTILDLPQLNEKEAALVVPLLQSLLGSPSIVTKFAAIKILNKLSFIRPNMLADCNTEMEEMISDPNRLIATYAVTTLLRTGNESSVESMMYHIQNFMEDVSDDFKIIIIDAIRSLCLKFPSKHKTMLKILYEFLRNDGGIEFKEATINAIFAIIRNIPETKIEAIQELCEFIEDCEYSSLAVRILHLLGSEGPKLANAFDIIRYVYNRLVLEDVVVRAAAVNALAKFALNTLNSKLEDSVLIILKRCLEDSDDEVRERALLQIKAIQDKQSIFNKSFNSQQFYSLPVLEKQLLIYISEGDFENVFDVHQIPLTTKKQMIEDSCIVSKQDDHEEVLNEKSVDSVKPLQQQLLNIPEFSNYGEIKKSSPFTSLTDQEMEYLVSSCVHVFEKNLVVQYEIKNTLNDSNLENVRMIVTVDDEKKLRKDFSLTCPQIEANQTGFAYISFTIQSQEDYFACEIENVLKFVAREIDPTTGELDDRSFEDEYDIENIGIGPATFLSPFYLTNFSRDWENLSIEKIQTYVLDHLSSIEEGIQYCTRQLSMSILEGSDIVENSFHTLYMAGKTQSDEIVLATLQMAYSPKKGVAIKLITRAKSEKLASFVAENF